MFGFNPTTSILGGVLAAALLGSTWTVGFFEGKAHEDKAVAVAAQKAAENERALGDAKVKALADLDIKDQQARSELNQRNTDRVTDLTAQVDRLSAQRNKFQKILDAKPNSAPGCHLALGDVRLLDDASKGGSPDRAAQGVPDSATSAAYQEQAPSDVSCRTFESVELTIRSQYNELSAIHDKLVDWVQAELIKPMQPAPSNKK